MSAELVIFPGVRIERDRRAPDPSEPYRNSWLQRCLACGETMVKIDGRPVCSTCREIFPATDRGPSAIRVVNREGETE